MRGRLALWLAAALAVLGLAPVAAHADSATVEVHDNYFFKQRTVINPGDTVNWTLVGTGHTVTSDDGSFDFGTNAAPLRTGDQVSYTFNERGVFYYHCEIHGLKGNYPSGMTGAVYVGVNPDGPSSEVRHVPAAYPTINAALQGIPPGSTVSVAPGVYHESIELVVKNVTIEGSGSGPGGTIIDGDGSNGNGITLLSNGDKVRRLSVRGFGDTGIGVGIGFNNVYGYEIRDVSIDGAFFGVRSRAKGGAIAKARISHANYGIHLFCSCGTVVEDGVIEGAVAAGIELQDATAVVVRAMTLLDNDVGLDVQGSQAVDVTGLTVRGGTTAVNVRHSFNPSYEVHVVDNDVSGYSQAGISWDLVGARVCFARNVDPSSPAGATTVPPLLQTLAPCA